MAKFTHPHKLLYQVLPLLCDTDTLTSSQPDRYCRIKRVWVREVVTQPCELESIHCAIAQIQRPSPPIPVIEYWVNGLYHYYLVMPSLGDDYHAQAEAYRLAKKKKISVQVHAQIDCTPHLSLLKNRSIWRIQENRTLKKVKSQLSDDEIKLLLKFGVTQASISKRKEVNTSPSKSESKNFVTKSRTGKIAGLYL